jgi:NAD(P)-dependent dehydrogenase (short-subunit alcohol dehydrogenase family)
MAVVVITGCSSGFGLEGALAFARNGDTVYATMRDVSKGGPLREAAEKEQLSLRIKVLDVSQPNTFDAFVRDVVKEAGRIDVLVNNAGMVRPGSLEDVSESALREVMEVNFFAPLLLTKAVLPTMRAQGDGTIIMMSSLSGIAGLPGEIPYTASKFALEGATEALRHEVDRWGVKVALVEAGMYATALFDSSMTGDDLLPPDYPADSPYRPLISNRLKAVYDRLPGAWHPRKIGELYVEIANSDGARLRWPADEVAVKVLKTMLAQDDASRDAFLRMVADADWWSQGKVHAG